LESEPFTPENALLTPSFKLNRLGLVKKYKEPLTKLYSSLESTFILSPFQQLLRKQLASVIFKTTGISIEKKKQQKQKNSKQDAESKGKGGEGEREREGEGSSLRSLGVDSISAMKLASLLKSELSIEISVGKLLMEEDGINKLLQLLGESPLPSSSSSSSASSSTFFLSGDNDLVNWRNEASLSSEFVTLIERKVERSSEQSLTVFDSKHVLLTGCTGFLGCFLLRDLLKSSSASASAAAASSSYSLVYCLVRGAKTKEGALARIVERLKYHLLYKEDEEEGEEEEGEEATLPLSSNDLKRIVPVLGDLSKPLFGLSQTEFLQLGEEVDFIIHNGCEVNGVFSYLELKNTNVEGTKELLKMAARKRTPFVFISSLSSFCGRVGDEETHFISPDETILRNTTGYG
jgi:acyl carrier protein